MQQITWNYGENYNNMQNVVIFTLFSGGRFLQLNPFFQTKNHHQILAIQTRPFAWTQTGVQAESTQKFQTDIPTKSAFFGVWSCLIFQCMRKLCPIRSCQPLSISVALPCLLSLLCFSDFGDQFHSLKRQIWLKYLYTGLSKLLKTMIEQWSGDSVHIGWIMAKKTEWSKSAHCRNRDQVACSLLCKIVKQCFIVNEWLIHSLLQFVMDYVSLLDRKPLINLYIPN